MLKPQSKCSLKKFGDPLHQHDDGDWYWYDEVWVEEFGPYPTREEAVEKLNRYCDEVLGVPYRKVK